MLQASFWLVSGTGGNHHNIYLKIYIRYDGERKFMYCTYQCRELVYEVCGKPYSTRTSNNTAKIYLYKET